MLKIFYPKIYVDTIYDIDWLKLKKEGINGLIFDLDNTLVPWDSDRIEAEIFHWLKERKKDGFKICLVSNNRKQRVEYFGELLELPAISRATKPRSRAFRLAMEMMGTTKEDTAVIGDQIFTDILGGNRLGLFTVLVVPKSKEEFIMTKITRVIEQFILRRLKKYKKLEEWD